MRLMLKWTLALKYTKTNSKNSFIWLQKISAMCLWIISKYIFRKSKQYWLFPNSYQLVSTLSENYFQAILTFSEFISDTHTFRELPLIIVNNFAEFISNNIDNLRELIPHILHTFLQNLYLIILTFSKSYWQKIPHFWRVHIKQYWHFFDTNQWWHFQKVTFKLNYSKNFFSIPHNADILRELLPKIIDFFRVHIKHYSNFQRDTTKQK